MKKICERINRFKNAAKLKKKKFEITLGTYSKKVEPDSQIIQILTILQREGYIREFNIINKSNLYSVLVHLKYNKEGTCSVRSIFPVTTPGRVRYTKSTSLWQPIGTNGLFLISTSKGRYSDLEARRLSLGGKIILGLFLYNKCNQ